MKPKDGRCPMCVRRGLPADIQNQASRMVVRKGYETYLLDTTPWYCAAPRHPEGAKQCVDEPCTREDYKDCDYREV